MLVDLLAGTAYNPAAMPSPFPPSLVFDSGLGGLTVFSEVLKARPDARFVYAADDAGFPYGRLSEDALVARVLAVMERLIAIHAPKLGGHRLQHRLDPRAAAPAGAFRDPVRRHRPGDQAGRAGDALGAASPCWRPPAPSRGTTPAISSRPMRPGAGSTWSARRASRAMPRPSLRAIRSPMRTPGAELAPCFVEDGGGRTDVVALACTHYPLLLPRFEALAPWPVTWIDPAPAIAQAGRAADRRAGPGHEADEDDALAVFTDGDGLERDAATRLGRNRPAADRRRGDAARARDQCGLVPRAAVFPIDFSAPSP